MSPFPFASVRRRCQRVVGALVVSLAGLSACGGSDQIDPFQARRIIALGDEASIITDDGLKYTVNALDDDGALDCEANPIWTQVLAESFGPRFPQCNPNGLNAPSLIYATVGAKAADLMTQVQAHLASDSFGSKDLVTVYAGLHDILELYAQYPAASADALTATAEARGRLIAEAVNAVSNAGGRVLVVTVPNVALTPFGVLQDDVGSDRRTLLSRLTDRFNASMRLGLLNDSGHTIGLVDAADLIQYRYNNPSSLGLTNVTDGACDLPTGTATTACTQDTLKKNDDGSALATATTWLWADDFQWSPIGHQQVGSVANTRARNNPF